MCRSRLCVRRRNPEDDDLGQYPLRRWTGGPDVRLPRVSTGMGCLVPGGSGSRRRRSWIPTVHLRFVWLDSPEEKRKCLVLPPPNLWSGHPSFLYLFRTGGTLLFLGKKTDRRRTTSERGWGPFCPFLRRLGSGDDSRPALRQRVKKTSILPSPLSGSGPDTPPPRLSYRWIYRTKNRAKGQWRGVGILTGGGLREDWLVPYVHRHTRLLCLTPHGP